MLIFLFYVSLPIFGSMLQTQCTKAVRLSGFGEVNLLHAESLKSKSPVIQSNAVSFARQWLISGFV